MSCRKWTIFICWAIFITEALSLKASSSLKLEDACPCSSTCHLPTTSTSTRASIGPPSRLVTRSARKASKQAIRPSIIDHLPPCPDLQTRCCWSYDQPYDLHATDEQQLEVDLKYANAKEGGKSEQQGPLLQDNEELFERSPKLSLRQELALTKLHLKALRQYVLENRQQIHLKPLPVGERGMKLACVECCLGEVWGSKAEHFKQFPPAQEPTLSLSLSCKHPLCILPTHPSAAQPAHHPHHPSAQSQHVCGKPPVHPRPVHAAPEQPPQPTLPPLPPNTSKAPLPTLPPIIDPTKPASTAQPTLHPTNQNPSFPDKKPATSPEKPSPAGQQVVNIIGRRPIYISLGHHRPVQVSEDKEEIGKRAKFLISQVKEELVSLLDRLKSKAKII